MLEPMSESESIPVLSDLLPKLALSYRLTKLKEVLSGWLHVVAEVGSPRFCCTTNAEFVPHSSALANGGLDIFLV